MDLLPAGLLRRRDGPDAPPPRQGADVSGGVALLAPAAVASLNAGRSDLSPPTPAGAAGPSADESSRSEASDLLESLRIPLNLLAPQLPLSRAGRAMLQALSGLSVQAVAFLQPVVEDLRVHSQNLIDAGAASTAAGGSAPRRGLVESLITDAEARIPSALLRISAGLQNKIIEDIDRQASRREANGRVHADALAGYGPLLRYAAASASNMAQGVRDRSVTAPASFRLSLSQIASVHAILAGDARQQDAFTRSLEADVHYLSVLQDVLRGGYTFAGSTAAAEALASRYASQEAKAYLRSLRKSARPLPSDTYDTTLSLPAPPFISYDNQTSYQTLGDLAGYSSDLDPDSGPI